MSEALHTLGRHLRQVARAPETAPGDAVLLGRFVAHRDEDAFAELVQRYGSLVLGVCRRIAGADADDVFQATFLVLARKAPELLNHPTLGGWLYGVAHRAARKARVCAARRRARETVAARHEASTAADPSDALAVIEQELHALPRRYREPLVLCVLCGRLRKEVAEELGVAEGTLSSRMAKARELLAERLRRRGVAVPAALLLTGEAVTRAAVPPELAKQATNCATGTVPVAVNHLATEVCRAMVMSKVRLLVLVATGLAACAVGLLARSPDTGGHVAGVPTAPLAEDKPALKVKELQQKVEGAKKELTGVWELQKQFVDGKEVEERCEYYRYTFGERTLRIEFKHKAPNGNEVSAVIDFNYTANPTTNPPQLNLYSKDGLLMCIYDLNKDTLKVGRHGSSDVERPHGFALKDKRVADLTLTVWEFKRAAAPKPEK